MRIRIQPFSLMRIWIQSFSSMWTPFSSMWIRIQSIFSVRYRCGFSLSPKFRTGSSLFPLCKSGSKINEKKNFFLTHAIKIYFVFGLDVNQLNGKWIYSFRPVLFWKVYFCIDCFFKKLPYCSGKLTFKLQKFFIITNVCKFLSNLAQITVR